jgi:hypothetical protein
MNRIIFVGFVMFCSALANGQAKAGPPLAYTPAARSVDESVNQWEQRSSIKVDADARSLISIDVRELKLSQFSLPKERYDDAVLWTKDVVVKSYLYVLRARNRALSEIGKAEIASYRLALYVVEHLKILGDPFGNIEFVSMPVGATIERDNKNLGSTRFGLVVPPGLHDYRIFSDRDKLDCMMMIDVMPGTTRTMRCPIGAR